MKTRARSILWVLTLVLAIGAAALAGCGAPSVRGHRVRAFFLAQRAPAGPVTGTTEGLDSEEAALIHSGYRNSLGPEPSSVGGRSNDDVIIIGEEQSRGRTR